MTSSVDKRERGAGVRFERLSVRRDGRLILDEVTAAAPCGGATVIVGPNGAGKTTLLRCLLGETEYAGRIDFVSYDGQAIASPVLGYVPQHLFADSQMPLRVYEFLSLNSESKPLWLGCSDKSRRKARESLELVGAEKLEKQRLGDLSGGELRRVLLASALGRRPQLLVLDEAEAGVDYRGERMFWELLDKSREEIGFTLLMVSHNLPLAAHYATHVICVKKEMIAQGAPRSTLTAGTLLHLFGVPIHLYPNQCANPGPVCDGCGALGNLAYSDNIDGGFDSVAKEEQTP